MELGVVGQFGDHVQVHVVMELKPVSFALKKDIVI